MSICMYVCIDMSSTRYVSMIPVSFRLLIIDRMLTDLSKSSVPDVCETGHLEDVLYVLSDVSGFQEAPLPADLGRW